MSTAISSLSSQMATNIFARIDTKNQGYLDKADMSALFDNGTLDDSSFDALDSDQDGKITKSEMTTGIENLLTQLNSASTKSVQGQQAAPPPPPPQGSAPAGQADSEDTGLTKQQLTEKASSAGDSKMAAMMNKVAENFEAADTNQDGKVTIQEARAYAEAQKQKQPSSGSAEQSDQQSSAMMKLAQLVQAYGLSEDAGSASLTATA